MDTGSTLHVPAKFIITILFLIHAFTWCHCFEPGCSNEIPECECESVSGAVSVDCSGRGLTEMPDFNGAQYIISHLDLSNNHLTTFPENLKDFPMLTTLQLSNNQISEIPSDALTDCTNLRYLYVNQNNITNWAAIKPNDVLLPAIGLESFSLAGNPLASFSTIDQTFVLISNSLKLLDLSDCRIGKITGQYVLQGLPSLEHLILSGNPLHSISNLSSPKLMSINLSHCKLTALRKTVFSQLPSLTYVNLSRNHRLSLTKNIDESDFVASDSLKRIDLSLCNMDDIELQGFPNLITAILRGNLITALNRKSFENNPILENLDFSYNAITNVSSGSFRDLRYLKHLDLSFNMIRRIEKDTFKHNDLLTSINLSRNYIDRLNRFVAKSLTHLNMSWCEIMTIDLDAFVEMHEIIDLDLSNNLFTYLPSSLRSDTMQSLNLERCRLTMIRNETFQGFPELSRINLAGNRFTTPFQVDYFIENQYLQDIWLGDNPWRCDCSTKGFYEFFVFVTQIPARISDRAHLKCSTPENAYGSTWDTACFSVWYAQSSMQMGTTQKVWTFMMVTILVFCGSVCLFMSIRKCIDGRKLTRREEQRLQNLEESREIGRRNRMFMDQEAQLNAPDPRESNPPCYDDAILMPRLDWSSLDDLTVKRNKRKNKGKEDEEEPYSHMSRRNRSRSENVLSTHEPRPERQAIIRDYDRPPPLPVTAVVAIVNRPVAATAASASAAAAATATVATTATVEHIEPSELHYHSTDILELHTNSHSGSSSENSKYFDEADDLVEHIERFPDNAQSSPYAQRKLGHLSSFRNTPPLCAQNDDEIEMVEDHYNTSKTNTSSDTLNSEDFSSFTSDEIQNLKKNGATAL